MFQFYVDIIDQLDLAIDQLAVRDRNFTRFAMMLVDNVAELTLHNYAEDKNFSINSYSSNKTEHKSEIIEALGRKFDKKVDLARKTGLISSDISNSLKYLHKFRNETYHQGIHYEDILHSLALFYLEIMLRILTDYNPSYFSSSSGNKISYRVKKYIGHHCILTDKAIFNDVWDVMDEVAFSIESNLILDLGDNMGRIINDTDSAIKFISEECPNGGMTRDRAILEVQAFHPMKQEEDILNFAERNNGPTNKSIEYIPWIIENYKWKVKRDPIPSWKKTLTNLQKEENKNRALNKYCRFISETEEIRKQINRYGYGLQRHLDQLEEEEKDRMREDSF